MKVENSSSCFVYFLMCQKLACTKIIVIKDCKDNSYNEFITIIFLSIQNFVSLSAASTKKQTRTRWRRRWSETKSERPERNSRRKLTRWKTAWRNKQSCSQKSRHEFGAASSSGELAASRNCSTNQNLGTYLRYTVFHSTQEYQVSSNKL